MFWVRHPVRPSQGQHGNPSSGSACGTSNRRQRAPSCRSERGRWHRPGAYESLGIIGDDFRVMKGDTATTCPGCGAQLPAADSPVHPYMTSSPACWLRYGDLLAVQYSNPKRMSFHQIVVDAYAVQHPDGDDPRAIRFVGIHLMTLCLFLEHGIDPSLGPRLHRRMIDRPVFHHLEAPPSRGRLTMLDVPLDNDWERARRCAYAWAGEVWTAWVTHHQTVRDWIEECGLATRA